MARYPLDIPDAHSAYTHNLESDDPNVARCAWAWTSSLVEVKNDEEFSAFHFSPGTDRAGDQKFLKDSYEGRKARMQLIQHVIEVMSRQHRTHFYSFYISGVSARVSRWDRAGCLVSDPIDLKKDARQFLEILYRLATSTDNYGTDETVKLATPEEIALVEAYDPGGNEYLQKYKYMMLDDRMHYPVYKVCLSCFDASVAYAGT